MREAFRQFVENVPFYGFAVMCIDHPEVQALIGRIEDRRIITYGASPQADVRYTDLRVEGGRSRLHRASSATARAASAASIEDLSIAMPGEHNVQNATGALAVAHHLGVSDEAIAAGHGRLRRGQAPLHPHRRWNGVEIIDDYGHHPVEIAAVLQRRPLGRRRAASSPSSSRTATRGCATSSTSSAPASTTPTW